MYMVQVFNRVSQPAILLFRAGKPEDQHSEDHEMEPINLAESGPLCDPTFNGALVLHGMLSKSWL